MSTPDSQAVPRPFVDWNTIDPRGELSGRDRHLLDLQDIRGLEAPMLEALREVHTRVRRFRDPAFRDSNW